MTQQVNTSLTGRGRSSSLVAAAVALPAIAVFVALQAPRAVPLPLEVPGPQIAGQREEAVERADLAATERLRDSPALREVDRRFGDWNEAESVLPDAGGALAVFREAFLGLPAPDRTGFLAARAMRFLVAINQVRTAVAEGREDRVALGQMRALVGRRFEERALRNGLIDADDLVLRAAFKLRILTAVDPGAIRSVSRVERLAFHGFVASSARNQSVQVRLHSIEEIARLDRTYPADLAAAILLSASGDHAAASQRLLRSRQASVRTRNHLLWLSGRHE